MSNETLPLLMLAGSDRRPGALPAEARGMHSIVAYKAAELHARGRALIEWVLDRYEASGRFGPIWIAGPRSAYGSLDPRARIVDTDADVATNLERGLAAIAREHEGPVALSASDILPDPDELRALVLDWESAPSALWFPMIRAPQRREDLEAFAWKPEYAIHPEPDLPAVNVLPSHLGIFDPRALRLAFLFELLRLGYRTRNRSVATRRRVILGRTLWALLREDVRHVLGLRLPTLTFSVVASGLTVARGLIRKTIDRGTLERAVARVILTSRHKKRSPDRRVRLPILDAMSLARDFDTEEEWRQVVGDGPDGGAAPPEGAP